MDNDQLEELTEDFYNIRAKYYNVEYRVGSGIKVTAEFAENQTPEEINALIKREYIDSAENDLTGAQSEMLKKILNETGERP